jgi:hypothetical protein
VGKAAASPTVSVASGNWAADGITLTCGLTCAWKAVKSVPTRPLDTVVVLDGPVVRLVREVGAPPMSVRGKGSDSSLHGGVILRLQAMRQRVSGWSLCMGANVQAVCDASLCFICLATAAPGALCNSLVPGLNGLQRLFTASFL